MVAVLPDFPDAEDVTMAIHEPIAPGKVVQSTPATWEPPLIQVRQVGGTSDRLNDRPVVEVSYFGDDYPAAKALASEGRKLMRAARASRVMGVEGHPNGVFVDKTEETVTPREVSYQDPSKRRKTATYRLVMRRPR